MKPSDFAEILRSYGAALAGVGGRSEEATLHLLAEAVKRTPEKTVVAILKRWVTFTLGSGGRPTLGEAARLLGPLRHLLEVGGKAAALTDLAALQDFLGSRSEWPIPALVDRAGTVPVKKNTKAQVDQELVESATRRFRDAGSDTYRFSQAFEEAKNLSGPEILAVARALTGSAARTKPTALKKIQAYHQALVISRAKAEATGGRSAA